MTAALTAVIFFALPFNVFASEPLNTTAYSQTPVIPAGDAQSPGAEQNEIPAEFLADTFGLEPLNSHTGEDDDFSELPAAQLTTDLVRDLSFKQPVASVYQPDGIATVTNYVQDAHSHILFDYDLAQGGSDHPFAGASLDFSHNPIAAGFVFGFKVSGQTGGRLKIRFTDTLDRSATVGVEGLSGEYQNFKITGQLLYSAPGSFDANHIKTIQFYVDEDSTGSPLAAGAVDIRTRGLAFMPQAAATTDPVRNFGSKAPFVDESEPCATAGQSPCQSSLDTVQNFNQDSRSHFAFDYDLSEGVPGRRFAGAAMDFSDDPVAAGFVLALKSSSENLKLEFVDNQNKKVTILVPNVPSGSFQNFKVTGDMLYSAGITGFNAKKIARITVLTDESTAGGAAATGFVEVGVNGLFYLPELSGADLADSLITHLFNQPELTSSGNADVTVLGPSDFEMEYNLSGGGFARAEVSRGADTMALPQTLTLAARGHSGTQLKVQIIDLRGKTHEVRLNLNPAYQNYAINLAADQLPVGFNRAKVALIRFETDAGTAGAVTNDVVKVKIGGLKFEDTELPAGLDAVRAEILQSSLNYFEEGVGIDPVTHFPYDNLSETGQAAKFTQPTLIGFYLQMLADVMNGRSSGPQGTMTRVEAVRQAGLVLNSLLQVQDDFGWKGLIPFMNVDPQSPVTTLIAFGDNANMAQSIAVFLGGIENAHFTNAEIPASELADIQAAGETALDNMLVGFHAMINHTDGRYHAVFDRAYFKLKGFMDKLGNEFRGALIFVTALLRDEYDDVPDSVLEGLEPVVHVYPDTQGNEIENLAFWNGGAFQAFWPLLRNNERDFASFRNALYNHLATQADWAADKHIPGFLSASQIPPGDTYYPEIGIPHVAENSFQHLIDVGSVYGLASAYSVDPSSVMGWLDAIKDQLPSLTGDFGFFDSARSGTEIARRFLGIDVASVALALAGGANQDFDAFLYTRGLAMDFNQLYEKVADSFAIEKTSAAVAAPPQFPDSSLSVFSHYSEEGTIGDFLYIPTSPAGARFNYSSLPTEFEGRQWLLGQPYNARAHKLSFLYSIVNSPKSIKIELKNAQDQIVYTVIQTMPEGAVDFQKFELSLPDTVALESVKRIVVLINQDGNTDTQGDFTLHAINFQHFPPG